MVQGSTALCAGIAPPGTTGPEADDLMPERVGVVSRSAPKPRRLRAGKGARAIELI